MQRIRANTDSIALCTAATALPNPPAQWAVVPSYWASAGRAVPEFDLSVWVTDADTEVTDARLRGAVPRTFAIADDDIDTVDFANNELDITTHAYQTGDGPLRLTTTDTLPAGLELATDYWAIYTNSGTIQLAASLDDALAGTAVAFTDGGTGTHTISDVASTARLFWHSHGLLGEAVDGAFSLAVAGGGYSVRCKHRPEVVAYSISGTLDGANDVSAAITAVEEA